MSHDTGSIGAEAETVQPGVKELDETMFAAAAAILSAAGMLILGVLGAAGLYEGGVGMMQEWHLFFEPTVAGTIAGIVEAAVFAFVVVYLWAWLYNSMSAA